ncbi:MAG TPA: START-like domain-containing protein, partial [Flavobacteriales bacterium]|nr:START-like domain-containing protein [Flavobacteriales bacterium]
AKPSAPPKAAPSKANGKPVAPPAKSAPVKAAAAPKAPEAPKAAAPAPKPAPAPKAAPALKGKAGKPKEPIIAVMTGIDPLGGPVRQLKRALKERFQLEFYLRATPGSLYDLLSTPSGLSEWFCNDVNVRGDEFTFVWGNDSQVAQCLSRKYGELIRFHWDDDEDPGAFFELRIRIDPMTNETCLVVTDHAWPKDMEEAKALWGSQIHTLARVLGA